MRIHTSVTSTTQRSINSFAHSWWVTTPQHTHVQWMSSCHAFPSCRHHLDQPGTEQFRGAVLLPSSHHPRSIPACLMPGTCFFPLPPAALLASISTNKRTAIVFPRENILGGFPSTGRNASAPPSLVPCSLCNIHILPPDSCKQIGSPHIFHKIVGLGVVKRDSWRTW